MDLRAVDSWQPHHQRVPIGLVLGVVVLTLLGGSIGASPAQAAVPKPIVPLPSTLDAIPEYHGQTICDPTPKPGTRKLGDLLDRTYGTYTKYYLGSPCPNGLEHQEGRALDWMVSVRIKKQRKKAEALINWLLAKGPNGETAANARRLGVLYLVWDNHIWGIYRADEGWREISNCKSKSRSGPEHDTPCHRDHIHFTLSWDGAAGKTSFWSGKAQTRPICSTSTVSRGAGSISKAKTLINTTTGKGVSTRNCRLAGNTRYQTRTYTIRVPKSGAYQYLDVRKFSNNAPAPLRITSAETIEVGHGEGLPKRVGLALNKAGTITFTLPAGYADLKIRGLGQGAEPPKIGLSVDSKARVHRQIRAGLSAQNIPDNATVQIRRHGSSGSTVVLNQRITGSTKVELPAPTNAGLVKYQAHVLVGGKIVASSAWQEQTIRPTVVRIKNLAARVDRGATDTFKVKVKGAPATATTKVLLKTSGSKWRAVSSHRMAHGKVIQSLTFTQPGRNKVKAKVRDGQGRMLAKTVRWVRVR